MQVVDPERADVPQRIGFKAFPYESTAVWLLTQLRRWNMIPADIDYKAIAQKVFLATNATKRTREMGFATPASPMIRHTIMGKVFDPAFLQIARTAAQEDAL